MRLRGTEPGAFGSLSRPGDRGCVEDRAGVGPYCVDDEGGGGDRDADGLVVVGLTEGAVRGLRQDDRVEAVAATARHDVGDAAVCRYAVDERIGALVVVDVARQDKRDALLFEE